MQAKIHFPAFGINLFMLDSPRVGRRLALSGCMLIAGVVLVLSPLIPSDQVSFFATTLMSTALLMNKIMCMFTMKITPGSLARCLVHVWQACHHFRLWHRLYLLYWALPDKVVQSVTVIRKQFCRTFLWKQFFIFSCSGSAVLGWEPLQWQPG